MTRYKPNKNTDYVSMAAKIGLQSTLDVLRKDILERNKHFYLYAAARRLKLEPSTLYKMGKRLGVDFTHWSEIITWKGIRDMNVNEANEHEK